MTLRRSAVAFLAALAGPASADECSDYRAAFVLHEAAKRATREVPYIHDPDTGRVTNEAQLRPFHVAEDRARRALYDVARAVQRRLDDAAAAAAIEAIEAAQDAIWAAIERIDDWPVFDDARRREPGLTLRDLTHYGMPRANLAEAWHASTAAYHHALHLACRVYTP